MLKIMLFPLVIALLGLVLIAVFAREGNVVSSISKSVKPSNRTVLPWALVCGIIFVGTIWLVGAKEQTIEGIVLIVIGFWLLMIAVAGMLISFSFESFKIGAPLAAQIGEEMSDSQKRSALRHGIRWFIQFKKW